MYSAKTNPRLIPINNIKIVNNKIVDLYAKTTQSKRLLIFIRNLLRINIILDT